MGAGGSEYDWAEGENGATRDYFNRAAHLAWEHPLGDWADVEGKMQGEKAFAKEEASKEAEGRDLEFEVTELVGFWRENSSADLGFFLRTVGGGGSVHFLSRESGEGGPRLEVKVGGEVVLLVAEADTNLDGSTYRSVGGKAERLRVGGRNPALVRFDFSGIPEGEEIERAILRIRVGRVYGGGAEIGVFRCAQGGGDVREDEVRDDGVAKRYPGDVGIMEDPAVVFACDFDGEDWKGGWTQVGPEEMLETVDSDAGLRFEPLDGRALRARIPEGGHTALNTLFKFGKEIGEEPEEIYFRYYLRLADDWNQKVQGGKMPGMSGTYGVAGWGGRKSNGANGWSARGQFFQTVPEGNPLAMRHPMGTYCYHADMEGKYGSGWVWSRGLRGFLENNRWYCVEQYVRLNTPGEKDGVIRAWIDGGLAFEKTDIRFRTEAKLKIEQVWMNVYHGGTVVSPQDQHLYIDDVVISREYVGRKGPAAGVGK